MSKDGGRDAGAASGTADSTHAESSTATGSWVRVFALTDLEPGNLKSAKVDGTDVVVANVDGEIYALEDMCSHEEYPLSGGDLEGKEVECMLHGARFNLCTGKATRLPGVRPVKTFEVEVRDGDIYVHTG